MGNIFPLYAQTLEYYKSLFPSLNLNCPIKPGPFYVMNYIVENLNETFFGSPLPNGIYRYSIKTFTKTDPMVFMVQWQTEVGAEVF